MKLRYCVVWPLAACWLAVGAASSPAGSLAEDFSSDPASRNWGVFGDRSLFSWNATNLNLEVTWDSSRPNSYFYRPLGTVLARNDDFSFGFDLRLRDIAIGVNPNKPFTFQIAVGLLNWQSATQSNFLRATGLDSPNLVEFNFFPDSGYGATVSTVTISSNNQFCYALAYQELTPNDLFRVQVDYTGSNQTLSTRVLRNGTAFAETVTNLWAGFSDFRVDTFAISSFSDEGQFPDFAGSILAHGVMDKLAITTPPAPLTEVTGRLADQAWSAQFTSHTNFTYYLEGTADLTHWTVMSAAGGNGGTLSLVDSNWHGLQFYRIRAERP